MTDQIWWFATRGAGLMTWAVAAGSVIFGLLMSSKIMGKQPGFPWLLDVHRFFSTLTAVFLALHLVTLWADSYVDFGFREFFVPHTSEWRRGAVTWGVLSMYLMIAVELTSFVRDRIPSRAWHGIHLLSYVSLVFGSVHAWQAGSDVRNPIVLSVGLATLALVVGLTVFRIAALKRGNPVHKPVPVDRAAMLAAARRRQDTPPVPVPARPTVQERWAEAAGRR